MNKIRFHVFTRIIALFCLSILIYSYSSQKATDEGYILFLYSGDQTKPFPRVMLYLPGTNAVKKDSIATHKSVITADQFERIKTAILNTAKPLPDSVLAGDACFQFEIHQKRETVIFLTPSFTHVREIFSKISIALECTGDQRIANELLESLLWRAIRRY